MRATILLLIAILSIGQSFGQKDITPNIVKAFQGVDALALSAFFIEGIDLSLPGHSDTYTVDEAAVMVRDFFQGKKTISFDIKHQGTSKTKDEFRICDWKTSKGSYRVTLLLKQVDKSWKVTQLYIKALPSPEK